MVIDSSHDEPDRQRNDRSLDWRWREKLQRPRGVVMTPAPDDEDLGYEVHATAYVPTRILLSTLPEDFEKTLEVLTAVATELGWSLVQDGDDIDLGDTEEARGDRLTRYPWATGKLGLRRYAIVDDRGVTDPDAWQLLRQARKRGGPLHGASLEHLVVISPFHSTPFHSTPFHSTPFHSTPFHSTDADPAGGSPIYSYLFQGSGGRQPVAYAGPAPVRATNSATRRALVGLLDTGCGEHEWLTLARRDVATITASPIGLTSKEDDPERFPDLIGPLDGMVDPVSGHGTFIAGLVHQGSPDADFVPWRVVPPDGIVDETELLKALGRIADFAEAGVTGGEPLDVLSLSLGYYHESPDSSEHVDITMSELLIRIRRAGTVVVCAAGNDATSRPMFPAALGPWNPGPETAPFADVAGIAPHISVGALNPDGSTVALFSNTGQWVHTYAAGAALFSTMPDWGGGAEALAVTDKGGKKRASIDPDEYSGGFALWSGTSFAAPVVAGKVAAALADGVLAAAGAETAAQRVARADAAVKAVRAALG